MISDRKSNENVVAQVDTYKRKHRPSPDHKNDAEPVNKRCRTSINVVSASAGSGSSDLKLFTALSIPSIHVENSGLLAMQTDDDGVAPARTSNPLAALTIGTGLSTDSIAPKAIEIDLTAPEAVEAKLGFLPPKRRTSYCAGLSSGISQFWSRITSRAPSPAPFKVIEAKIIKPAHVEAPITWNYAPSKELREKIATYLENESKINDIEVLPADHKQISSFHSVEIPSDAISKYFNRLIEFLDISEPSMITALVLMNHIAIEVPLNSFTIHRLLLTCMCVATKMTGDCVHNNADFATVGGVSIDEINLSEGEFISCESFKGVSFEDYQTMLRGLLDFDALISTKEILPNYIFVCLSSIVKDYVGVESLKSPSLFPYVSICRLFPPKISDSKEEIFKPKQKPVVPIGQSAMVKRKQSALF